jgi:hypothetical protein
MIRDYRLIFPLDVTDTVDREATVASSMRSSLAVLVVIAHPDDETLFAGNG